MNKKITNAIGGIGTAIGQRPAEDRRRLREFAAAEQMAGRAETDIG